MPQIENVILFDMDGTLCDFEKPLLEKLEELRSPEESRWTSSVRGAPEYIRKRAKIICASEEWWANLPKFQLGWDILEITRELGYKEMILTQGPRKNPAAWTGKKLWIDRNLGQETNMTITRDKGLVYGKGLVDDYPGYIQGWLEWRTRGLVIMPANKENKGFTHPNLIRYDGTNLNQVREALVLTKERASGEPLDLSPLR